MKTPIFYDKPKSIKYNVGDKAFMGIGWGDLNHFKQFLKTGNLDAWKGEKGTTDLCIAKVTVLGYNYPDFGDYKKPTESDVVYVIKTEKILFNFYNNQLPILSEDIISSAHYTWLDVWGEEVYKARYRFKKLGFEDLIEGFVFR